MARGGKRKMKPLIEESDEEGEEGILAVSAAGESSDDDAEANADLSLQIAERAMKRRGVVLNGSIRAGTSGGLAPSSSADSVGTRNGEVKGTTKLKRKKKQEVAESSMRKNGSIRACASGGVGGLAGELATSSSADLVVTANGEVKGMKKIKKKKKLEVAERAMRQCDVQNGGIRACTSGGVRGLAGELESSSSANSLGVANEDVNELKKMELEVRDEDAGGRSMVPALIGEENAEAVEKLEAAVEDAVVVGAADVDSDNLELRKLLRGPRYFDPPSSAWTTCYNCGEEGHFAVNCTTKKKRRPCFVCGSLDHHSMQCPKCLECFICKKAGHRARDCSDKHGHLSEDSELCLKCGEFGHDMFSCGNDYHPEDLKEIQCYLCKKFGHLCCVNFVNSNKTVISCFRCGKLGHDGLACSRLQKNDRNSGVASAYDSMFKNKSSHSASLHATKAMKKLSEAKVSSVLHSRKNKKKSSPKTAPPAGGKTFKKRNSRIDKGTNWTPQKSRGGWFTDDTGDTSRPRMKRCNWNSPSTPSSSKPYKYDSGGRSFRRVSEVGHHQQYSASRSGYSSGLRDGPVPIRF